MFGARKPVFRRTRETPRPPTSVVLAEVWVGAEERLEGQTLPNSPSGLFWPPETVAREGEFAKNMGKKKTKAKSTTARTRPLAKTTKSSKKTSRSAPGKGVYDEGAIQSLDALEHIRLRTGMYIGRVGDGSHPQDGIYILL